MIMKDLYIIGAGGFGREVAWLVERINQHKPTWKIKGFIDDNTSIHGEYEDGYEVVGGVDFLLNILEEVWVICAVGSAIVRKKIIQRLENASHIKYATLVDPSVICSQHISIGNGSIVCAGTIITVDVSIGNHVIINLDCTLGHDDIIQDYVTIYPSVNVSGCVYIGEVSEIGTGTNIIQGVSIGTESIIGAGSVVIRDIEGECTAVGSPCKVIKRKK